jgi:hypothetical protein
MQSHSASHTLQNVKSTTNREEHLDGRQLHTVCEIAESVASTILEFSGRRNRECDDDGKGKPKIVNDTCIMTLHAKHANSQDIQGHTYVLQSGQCLRSQAAHDRVTEHAAYVHTTNSRIIRLLGKNSER